MNTFINLFGKYLPEMSDRYSRQELYFGRGKQAILGKKVVSIIGVGALGSVSAELLARAGIGKLKLIDRDFVEESNLQRQSLFDENDVGKLKAEAAAEKLGKINSIVKLEYFSDDLSAENIGMIDSDMILDCTDNMGTRFLIDDYCAKKKIPWIHASAIENKGFVFNVLPGKVSFSDIFNNLKGIGTCDTIGVMNSITHLIGSMQANEAIKILTGKDHETDLIFIDLDNNILRKLKVKKNPKFKRTFEHLKIKRDSIKFCSSGLWQIRGEYDFNEVKKRLDLEGKDFLKFKNMTILKNRVLIKADNEKEAKAAYSKWIGD